MTVIERLSILRNRLSDLEWAGEADGDEAHRIAREIEYLTGYVRLGYTYEPEF